MADTSKPDYSSAEYQAFSPLWTKADDCLGGTEAMRSAAGKDGESPYLPQFPMEADDSYDYRLKTSTFMPAYGDALDMIVGAITRRPPTLNSVSAGIEADWENIDKAGTHWTVFAQRLLRTGAHYGAAYVLTEMPKKPKGIFDAEQSKNMNFRPFSLLYSAKELADWPRYVVIDGAKVLQEIRFRECYSIPDGFGNIEVERFRVWRVPVEVDDFGNYRRTGNAEWEIWEEQEIEAGKRRRGQKKTELTMIDSDTSPLADIPVAVFNANPDLEEPEETEGPVLLNLANVNIKHYQITSDHEKILHKCAPILTAVNRKDAEISPTAGLDVLIDCLEGGSVSYAEPPGTSLAERREWIAAIEKQMLEMGASLFAEGSQKGAMTATEVKERGGAKQSRISQIAGAWHDCMETVLGFFAQWKGEEPSGEITPGVKSSDLVLTAADLPTISGMVEKKQHSLRTMWAIEKKLGILPDDFDDEKELDKIEEEQKRLTPAPVQPVIQQTEPPAVAKGATA